MAKRSQVQNFKELRLWHFHRLQVRFVTRLILVLLTSKQSSQIIDKLIEWRVLKELPI